MILVCGGIKGGSGKTTAATNLAIIRSKEGADVLLIDADDQETATDFTVLREEQCEEGAGYTSIKLTGSSVRTQTQRLMDKYQDIVIDTGGRDTTSQRAALSIADILLVPFIPRSFDLWTLERTGSIVEEMKAVNEGLRVYSFLNQADPQGSDNTEAAAILRDSTAIKFSDVRLGRRKAFGNAVSLGLGVTELKPRDKKAFQEIMMLYRYIYDIK